jgi:hypothetical protein
MRVSDCCLLPDKSLVAVECVALSVVECVALSAVECGFEPWLG